MLVELVARRVRLANVIVEGSQSLVIVNRGNAGPISLPTWRDRDSPLDASVRVVPSRFRNFKIILSFETEKKRLMTWVDRNAYMERLWALEGIRGIKTIAGMCRSGKSELMKAFSASVARKDPSSNNVYIDLLDLGNEPLLEYHTLHRENARVD